MYFSPEESSTWTSLPFCPTNDYSAIPKGLSVFIYVLCCMCVRAGVYYRATGRQRDTDRGSLMNNNSYGTSCLQNRGAVIKKKFSYVLLSVVVVFPCVCECQINSKQFSISWPVKD